MVQDDRRKVEGLSQVRFHEATVDFEYSYFSDGSLLLDFSQGGLEIIDNIPVPV